MAKNSYVILCLRKRACSFNINRVLFMVVCPTMDEPCLKNLSAFPFFELDRYDDMLQFGATAQG
jgi:hypothetical protein